LLVSSEKNWKILSEIIPEKELEIKFVDFRTFFKLHVNKLYTKSRQMKNKRFPF